VEVDIVDEHGERDWARLLVRAAEGPEFPGWWRRYGAFVLTVAADAEMSQPVGYEEPPRLADATPAHSWLP
jgi:4'-phosphopantetheinyl transferase